jgi:hypothetical protein
MRKKLYVNGRKLYVNGSRINRDEWEIEYFSNAKIEDYDEEFREDMEYITDEFGQIQGVGWEV